VLKVSGPTACFKNGKKINDWIWAAAAIQSVLLEIDIFGTMGRVVVHG